MSSDLTELVFAFEQALLALDRVAARRLLTDPRYVWTPLERVERLIVPALDRIGKGWEEGYLALSQVYMSSRICEELVDGLLPAVSQDRKSRPRMAIAVLDDYHLLGKRLVYSTLRASGYALADYGRATADEIVRRTAADDVEILLISVLMLPSALRVRDVRAQLDRLGRSTRIVVGGAPFRFDEQLWQEVGADAMGHSASEAPAIVAQLAQEMGV